VVALEQAGAYVQEKLGASERLARVQAAIDEELQWAKREAQREGADRRSLIDVIVRLASEVR